VPLDDANGRSERQTPLGTPQEAFEREKPKVWRGPSSSELIVGDLVRGTGPAAKEGDILFVRYAAGIFETGEELEPARSASEPVGFLLGGGDWTYGWEEGMGGMRVGGRRVLIFPTTATTTPPGSVLGDTLIYVVDLLRISSPTG